MVPLILPTERSTAVGVPATGAVSGVESSVGEQFRAQACKFEVVTNAVVTISERPELGIVGMGIGMGERLGAANAIPDKTVVVRGEENRPCWGRRSFPRSRRSSKRGIVLESDVDDIRGHETPEASGNSYSSRAPRIKQSTWYFLFFLNLRGIWYIAFPFAADLFKSTEPRLP